MSSNSAKTTFAEFFVFYALVNSLTPDNPDNHAKTSFFSAFQHKWHIFYWKKDEKRKNITKMYFFYLKNLLLFNRPLNS